MERAEPRSVEESNQAAADARNRLFVLFLDSYHTSIDASMAPVVGGALGSRSDGNAVRLQPASAADSRIGRALVTFLQQLIGPDDLIAVTRPELPVDALSFTRRPSSFDNLLLTGGDWQREWNYFDNVERGYQACYPGEGDVVYMMIARRRERMVIDALRNLVTHLQGLREERKAILRRAACRGRGERRFSCCLLGYAAAARRTTPRKYPWTEE